MEYNYSYNVLIDRFKAFADGHYLIKRFTHGQIDLADMDNDEQYPFMHVTPDTIKPANGSITFGFHVMFADIPRDKETKAEYQREVISDCVRLAQDLIGEIKNGLVLFGYDVQMANEPTLEPFMEEYKNTLTGIAFTIELEVPYNWSACDIPANWTVGGSSSGGAGSPIGVVFKVNGINNAVQNVLDLVAGSGITIVDNGDGSVTFTSTGGGGGGGTVTSVGLTVPPAFSVAGSPVTTSGTLAVTGAGNASQYIDGTGALQTFPAIPSPQGLQDVITTDNNLTTNNIIKGNTFNLTWQSNEQFRILPEATGFFEVFIGKYPPNESVLKITASDAVMKTVGGTTQQFKTDKVGLYIQTPAVDAGSATNGQILTLTDAATGEVEYTTISVGSGTVTSVGLTVPTPANAAFTVSGSPVTTSGTLAISANGTSLQYVDGTGALQTLPTGLPPTGAAGGDLQGTYPNPVVHQVHGIEMQSGTPTAGDVWLYEGSPAKWQHQPLPASHVNNDSAVTGTHVDDALNHLSTTKVEANAAITGATATKITYDSKGLVTSGTSLTASDLPSSIDAIKIGTGTVDNTEFGYLNGVTSAIQTQLNNKKDTITYGQVYGTTVGASTTVFAAITGLTTFNATETNRQFAVPVAGTLKNFYVKISGTQSATGTMVITVRNNATSSSVAVTVANGDGASPTKSDNTNTLTVAAGDLLAIQLVNNATATSASILSMAFIIERT